MRMTRFALFALVPVTLIAAGLTFAGQTAGAKAAKSGKSSAVDRGKYLVSVMGCTDCHTPGTLYGAPDMSRFLSGSELGWEGPWGVVYAANLTPDTETGLGKWTVEQIAKAIRTGNRPDGRQLAPIMPWMNFAHLTDEDAMAIASYLKTVPAVKHVAPAPVPPGVEVAGSVLRFPPPPAWDAPREGAAGGH